MSGIFPFCWFTLSDALLKSETDQSNMGVKDPGTCTVIQCLLASADLGIESGLIPGAPCTTMLFLAFFPSCF